jgi:dihydroorotase
MKETIESASMAAAAGGFGTVFCMANTYPVTDSLKRAESIKLRADALGLIDLHPALSLTRGMEGMELSEVLVNQAENGLKLPLLLSEDGKDLADEELFFKAMKEARRLGIPISCHCDFGGSEAEAAKKAGKPRKTWSRIEENFAVQRVIGLGKKADCRIHIAHVSTKEAVEMVRAAKKELPDETEPRYNNSRENKSSGFCLSCEAAPHHFCLGEEDAEKMGDESFGRVNPPLRSPEDREAVKAAIKDGTIDLIATDHAPHTLEDKAKGAPGFSGLETAFAASFTELVRGGISARNPIIGTKRLSALMSANPCRLAGLKDRGRLVPGLRADLVVINSEALRKAEPLNFKTRGKNSPFAGQELYGQILLTFHGGRIVYSALG